MNVCSLASVRERIPASSSHKNTTVSIQSIYDPHSKSEQFLKLKHFNAQKSKHCIKLTDNVYLKTSLKDYSSDFDLEEENSTFTRLLKNSYF